MPILAGAQLTPVYLNIYDLLPPTSLISTFIWTCGLSLLHTSIEVHGKEYQFGGHDVKELTGVYATPPNLADAEGVARITTGGVDLGERKAPEGAHWRETRVLGWTSLTAPEVKAIVAELGMGFLGVEYDLLRKNCNHFTAAFAAGLSPYCAEALIVPEWINRAAELAVKCPCIVPSSWIEPPELEDGEEEDEEERTGSSVFGKDVENPGFVSRDSYGSESGGGSRRSGTPGEMFGGPDICRINDEEDDGHYANEGTSLITPTGSTVSRGDSVVEALPRSERVPVDRGVRIVPGRARAQGR
ncbi:DUF862-domain-containing protein [Saitoella complicata NRRL Y-17804]|uniref:PPPDE domain-containing protein n=1 Tax=Saitoella complicata (strain BCRC 22490 / CBS 7301 / JCM 7358 / NBRC 10748 / NRRL Y-17804) TaxID=698492 RepID=A0A0E9NH47_SAICN|nr:DUF862-domain-containing protein [Saitoella complicata NRRL Y-17804]ODQ53044.1 DUF862-domain-containing protein [Saitoella complicata NRRL Y-17804]GAO48991.1 hypothetical protein G7K_3152-t1 [Saitoella complicata NRRL Y-17804]